MITLFTLILVLFIIIYLIDLFYNKSLIKDGTIVSSVYQKIDCIDPGVIEKSFKINKFLMSKLKLNTYHHLISIYFPRGIEYGLYIKRVKWDTCELHPFVEYKHDVRIMDKNYISFTSHDVVSISLSHDKKCFDLDFTMVNEKSGDRKFFEYNASNIFKKGLFKKRLLSYLGFVRFKMLNSMSLSNSDHVSFHTSPIKIHKQENSVNNGPEEPKETTI